MAQLESSSFNAKLIINELDRIKADYLKTCSDHGDCIINSSNSDCLNSSSHKTLVQFIGEEMKLKHAVNVTVHGKYPQRLICLHYNQTRANFENSLTRACRGVIVDLEEMRIVHMPFSKFFNFNEPMAKRDSEIISEHFDHVKIYEKFDGSIVNFYFFDGEWRVASSSTPDGSAKMGFYSVSKDKEENEKHRQESKTFVFADLVWNAFNDLGFKIPPTEFEGKYSFTFELLTQKHPLVVQHPEQDNLILHGVRCLETFSEKSIEPFAQQFNWKYATCVKEKFGFKSLEDVSKMADERNAYEHEGFVVCYETPDNNGSESVDFIRVKIKNSEYVKISLTLFDSVEKRENSFIEIIKKNESSEFLAYFPQFESAFHRLKLEYNSIVEKLNNVRGKIEGIVEELVKQETDTISVTRMKALQSIAIQQAKDELKFSKTIADIMFGLCSDRQLMVEDVLKSMPLKRYKTLLF
ncbi:predicted protein [Naegleria gruberi]|uniref:Predicted protein n=1 Tax=Naegleria gruberi TaxID=5762 RepID=D2VPK1_NAEGR|nr:uncharacterized protein NAEGRDRAFT_51245 [Naegleria gruberi]EFC41136.1 predicted protein [Naegleria gruberi]|eukprot:XP_002673880.1 predicted protein [Naegleria gruberi strain NEG-M]